MALAGFGCSGQNITDASVARSTLNDVAGLLQQPDQQGWVLVDVRPAEEFAAGRIPGSVNLRLIDVVENRALRLLSGKRPIVVYGKNPGSVSAVAMARTLLEQGLKGVSVFEGGVDAWIAAGLPLVEPEPPA